MKKLLLILIGLGLVACNAPFGELHDIAGIPGVEPGRGKNNYNEDTTYKGAMLPSTEYEAEGRERMVELLKLIDSQDGDIDDVRFVQMLEEYIFSCTERFMYIHDPEPYEGEPTDYWSDARDWVGGTMYHSLAMYGDYSFVIRYHPPCAFISEEAYIHKLGYEGWSSRGVWHYDAEDDMLYTSEDMKYAAKVLYFDGEVAVLEGFVFPMWLYNGPDYKCSTPMELYRFEFVEGKDEYLNGYEISYEEYMALVDEYHEKFEMFEGKDMPYNGAAAQEKMRDCIALLDKQQPEDIDDEAFVEMLTTMRLNIEDRFGTTAELEYWGWGLCTYYEDFDKVSFNGDMFAYENGTYVTKRSIYKTNEHYDAVVAANCLGWYCRGEWSYNADNNIFTMMRDGEIYESEICYFDTTSGELVLRGRSDMCVDVGYEDEIYRCKFYNESPINYLKGYVTYDEFKEFWATL